MCTVEYSNVSFISGKTVKAAQQDKWMIDSEHISVRQLKWKVYLLSEHSESTEWMFHIKASISSIPADIYTWQTSCQLVDSSL